MGDEVELSYWKRGREMQHSMFHSRLKVTHGLISRVKEVLDAYGEMMSKGKLSPDRVRILRVVVANMPAKAVPHAVSNTTSQTAATHVATSNGTVNAGPHVEAATSIVKAQAQMKKQ